MGTRVWLAVAGAIVITSASSLAWACVPASWWVRVSPSSGTPGTAITVTGKGFASDESVSIYWDSSENKLAEAAGPEFSVNVRIPTDAAVGVHYIRATGSSGRGGATDPFEVVTNAPLRTAPPATQNQAGGQHPAAGTVLAPGVQTSEPLVVTTPRPRRSAPARERADRTATPDTPVARGVGGVPVFAGSVAPALMTFPTTPPATPGSTPSSSTTGSAARSPSTAAAADPDVWSGFANGRTPSLTSDAADAPGSETASGIGVGIALLAGGLLALVAGLVAAEVRRRRLTA